VSVIQTGGWQSYDNSKFTGCVVALVFTFNREQIRHNRHIADMTSKQIIPF